ncbi:hypothetical protein [Ureaplasma ceti]|uniref:Uncharacterized protein n=1 Tax=Ureaplasma ceti TaxID=3119530 RepID=A0ABP9U6H9_9BACT
MKLTKKGKYALIGVGVAVGVLGAIFIPVGTVYGTMTQSLPPFSYGPWKDVPNKLTAEKLVQQFPHQTLDLSHCPEIQPLSFQDSLKDIPGLQYRVRDTINNDLMRISLRKKTFQWDQKWLKNLIVKMTPVQNKPEYKLTLSLMSGPDLSVTVAKDPLYVTGFATHKFPDQLDSCSHQYLSLYSKFLLIKNTNK